MSQLAIVCLSPEMRRTIAREIKAMDGDPVTKRIALTLFEEMPECKGQQPIGLAIQEGEAPAGRGKRSSRAPSEYNTFIGSCMKGGARTIKDCAADWKRRKR